MGLYFRVNDNLMKRAYQAGAVWNELKKAWYFDKPEQYFAYKDLLLNGNGECIVAHDKFYIMVGRQRCFKCGKSTTVIAFGLDDVYFLYNKEVYGSEVQDEHSTGFVFRFSQLQPLTDKVLQFLKNDFKYFLGHSKFTDSNYFSNHCDHCGVLQGDFFLFQEVGSPFFFDSEDKVSQIDLIEVPLEHDVIVGYDSIDSKGWPTECFGSISSFSDYIN